MTDDEVKQSVVTDIIHLKELGIMPVIVHGGGRAIKELLDEAGLQSEFVGGHRKTDAVTMRYVEMALTGRVNSELVRLINGGGLMAVGLSGKDGGMVTARKRLHRFLADGKEQETDLGFVGDVEEIDTGLIRHLIRADYVPVISPVATGRDLNDYNINADMFAGHMAGALGASSYIALTDVDGLMRDKDDPSTLVHEISLEQAEAEIGGMIQGGMIPKIESCIIALRKGVQSAHIVNGMAKHSILKALLAEERPGTMIKRG